MFSMGQLTHLPESIAANPFHRPLVKFSRYKTGSYEAIFAAESFLLRYSWAGLLVLLGLVLPPLEEVDVVSTLVRLCTMVYPALFVWSLTRISGVELMQLVLEGRWTAELLAAPLSDRELMLGFVAPVWLVVRQYLLITVFSLVLSSLETNPIVRIDDHLYLDDVYRSLAVNLSLFFSVVAWIIFIYLARLLLETRLRNGLLKGLFTLLLFGGGVGLMAAYSLLFFRYPALLASYRVLATIDLLSAGLLGGAVAFHGVMRRNFRRFLGGQLDLDPLIFDAVDPHASEWERVG